jgi:hypothetical protein
MMVSNLLLFFQSKPRKTPAARASEVKKVSLLDKDLGVKVTAATILREGRLIQKQREKEVQSLKDVEVALRSTEEFRRWQLEMDRAGEREDPAEHGSASAISRTRSNVHFFINAKTEMEQRRSEQKKLKLKIQLHHEETYLAKVESFRSKKCVIQLNSILSAIEFMGEDYGGRDGDAEKKNSPDCIHCHCPFSLKGPPQSRSGSRNEA